LNWFWKKLVIKALNWVIDNANVRMYSSRVLVGTLFRGHDISGVNDVYWVLDIRCSGHILLLGSFQVS
jgi:hypothetical protein